MTTTDMKRRLNELADEAAEMAQAAPEIADTPFSEQPARLISTAGYYLEEAAKMLKTEQAVKDMVQTVFTARGGVGDAEAVVLRRRAA